MRGFLKFKAHIETCIDTHLEDTTALSSSPSYLVSGRDAAAGGWTLVSEVVSLSGHDGTNDIDIAFTVLPVLYDYGA